MGCRIPGSFAGEPISAAIGKIMLAWFQNSGVGTVDVCGTHYHGQ
jgi:hypothetical protein